MIHISRGTLCLLAGIVWFSQAVYAVDPLNIAPSQPPAETKTDSDRYGLIGVITGTNARNHDIAVISDLQTGKSLTVQVGSPIPGNPNYVLKQVSRNLAVLEGLGQVIQVRTAVGSYAKPESEKAMNDLDSKSASPRQIPTGASPAASGLLERWAAERGPMLMGRHGAAARAEQAMSEDDEAELLEEGRLDSEDEDDILSQPGSSSKVYRVDASGEMPAVLPQREFSDPEIQGMAAKAYRMKSQSSGVP